MRGAWDRRQHLEAEAARSGRTRWAHREGQWTSADRPGKKLGGAKPAPAAGEERHDDRSRVSAAARPRPELRVFSRPRGSEGWRGEPEIQRGEKNSIRRDAPPGGASGGRRLKRAIKTSDSQRGPEAPSQVLRARLPRKAADRRVHPWVGDLEWLGGSPATKKTREQLSEAARRFALAQREATGSGDRSCRRGTRSLALPGPWAVHRGLS